jgi:phosphatidate cytidylyltransferase
VVCVVAMLAMREYMDLVKAYGYEPLRLSTYLLVPLYFALLAVLGHEIVDPVAGAFFILLAGAFVLPVAFVYALLGLHKDLRTALPSVALNWTGFVLVAFALATLVLIRVLPLGPFYLLYLFVVVWSGDIIAFWVGSAVGKHKLAPEVSPKKTWEGAIASVVTAALLGALLLQYSAQIVGWLQHYGAGMSLDWAARAELSQVSEATPKQPGAFLIPFWKALLWSALINVAAQFGDLVESMMKRGAGVKDSGAILPGHGGMLDRVDALLFAAPFGFAVILFAIHS